MRQLTMLAMVAGIFLRYGASVSLALFSESGTTTGTFETVIDWRAPETTTDALSAFQTSTTWTIFYSSVDEETGLDFVKLYYRKGTAGLFQLYGTTEYDGQTSVSSSFSFTAVEGDGTYEFYAISKDLYGNIEIAPTGPFVSTVLDTLAPATTLTTSSGIIVGEQVNNGNFSNALSVGWSYSGEVARISSDQLDTDGDGTNDMEIIAPSGDGSMARVGQKENFDGELASGQSAWDNKLTQIIEKTNSYLSFYYRVVSFDASENPAAIVMANDTEILRVTGTDLASGYPNDSGWRRIFIDLSDFSDSRIELKFYAGNTDPFLASQSWMYIDNVTTGKPALNSTTSDVILTAVDTNGIAGISYSVDNGITWDFVSGSPATISGSELVPDTENNLLFYATDDAGNVETAPLVPTEVIVDNQSPDIPESVAFSGISEHELALSWIAPADAGYFDQASRYVIRANTLELTSANFWSSGWAVPNSPSPAATGQSQALILGGFDPSIQYWIGIAACDAVWNCSAPAIANAATIIETDNNPGDVVINELMWMGMNGNAGDEWIELRNMTDRAVDLTGWYITKLSSGIETTMYTFGAVAIAPHGYFVISEYDETNSALAVTPNAVVGSGSTNDATFALANSDMHIRLYDSAALQIDSADDGTNEPMAGLSSLDAISVFYSMERNAIPGNGEEASSWHTTFADTGTLFDTGLTTIRGTPGQENLSQPTMPAVTQTTPLTLSTSAALNTDLSAPAATTSAVPTQTTTSIPASVEPEASDSALPLHDP